MKLAVFGATGPSGVELVKQALAEGHDVTALVRDPDKMAELVPNKDLKVCGRSWPGAVTLYTDSMEVIVTSMRKNNIKRLVCMTSWYTTDDPESPAPFIVRWFIKPVFLGRVLTNMAQMEQFLQGCDDINFTVVRPPHLTMGPVTDMEFRTEEGTHVREKDGMRGMCRADVARFMLSTVTSNSEDWMRKCVAVIAVPKT
ncbi:hypothetical protein Bbelb_241780 [Branchiostoma belcheri]|nr:hypothetical protein Bbelb_241780 [Branchiostoma belcheri]